MRSSRAEYLIAIALVCVACKGKGDRGGDRYQFDLPPNFSEPAVPARNPMSAAKVELGRHLFYDERLSGNGTQSCASCHEQARAFTENKPRSIGSTGEVVPRNAPTLVNSAYYATLTWWNPILEELEQQIRVPMFGDFPVELGITGHEPRVMSRLRSDERYQKLFAEAFPGDDDPFDFDNVVFALASFVRAMISADSAYDRGELSPAASRGLALFESQRLRCRACHSGVLFAAPEFHNTGLYDVDGRGSYPPDNTGMYATTSRPADMGRFRVPSLRNVALTAPYYHDGTATTLEEVIRNYEAGGRGAGRSNRYKSGLVSGFSLSDRERQDLIAFLESLTDESLVTDPRFSAPRL